ncbi:hypothetical protein ACF082_06370 [Streptomyces lydicus]|nr:hypothetical protein [Streptomyces lydicus]
MTASPAGVEARAPDGWVIGAAEVTAPDGPTGGYFDAAGRLPW